MITERTLRNWRRDALNDVPKGYGKGLSPLEISVDTLKLAELNQRILRLTQELLDLQLMRKG